MSDWLFAVHAPDGIDAAALATFEDDEIGRGTTVRHVTHGAASNNILIVDALNAKAQHIVRGACIKVYRTALSTTVPQTFFFIDKIETKVVGEDQDYKVLAASGTGTLWHLANAVLLDEPYTTAPIPRPDLRGGLEVEGMWVWGADEDGQRMGAICRRAYEEGRDQPSSVGDSPFYAVDADFNRTVDSAGVAWPAEGERYEKPIGTSVLEVFQDAVASGLYAQMTGKSGGRLNLSVYQSMREDRSGAVFGAGAVRFVNLPNDTDNNIATDLTRQENDRQVSDLLVAGDEFVYERAGDAGANMPRWETIRFPSNDPSLLQLVAERNLLARNLAIDAIRFPLARVGDDEANGVYYISPEAIGGHAWMADTVTVHTGATSRDLSEADFPLAAWELRMEDDWEEWVEVGHVMIDSQRRAFEQAVTSIRHTLELCRPGGVGGDTVWHTGGDIEARSPAPGNDPADVRDLDHGTFCTSRPFGSAWFGLEFASPVTVSVFRVVQSATPIADSATAVLLQYNNGSDKGESSPDWTTVSTAPFAGAVDTGEVLISSAVASGFWRIVNNGEQAVGGLTFGWSVFEWYIGTAGAAGSAGDGHPDLIGTSIRAARCDHRHDVHRDRAPSATDDATQGYRVGTTWAFLDDLDNPTAIVGVFMLLDATEGAAVWADLRGGTQTAAQVPYDNTVSGLAALDVQDAIDELAASPGGGALSVEDDEQNVQVDPTTKLQFDADDFAVTDEGSDTAKVAFIGTAAADITIEEADGTPSVASVSTIKVGNGDLTDEGSGVVRIKTAADAGGSGDLFGIGVADRPPASPHADDDEFAAALSGWTTLGSPTTHDANSTAPHHYYVTRANTTVSLTGIYKAIPSMPFTVTAKLSGDNVANVQARAGLFVAEATPGKVLSIGRASNLRQRVFTDIWSSPTAFSSTPASHDIAFGAAVYLRMVVASSTSVSTFWSLDGFTWFSQGSAINPSMTIGSVGLMVDPANGGHAVAAIFDWIRFS